MDLTKKCYIENPLLKLVDFTFYRGTTFRYSFVFLDKNGDAIDITGMEIIFHLLEIDDTVDYLTISSDDPPNINGSSVTVIDAEDGEADLILTPDETTAMSFDRANWWISLTLDNNDLVIKAKGQVLVKEPFE